MKVDKSQLININDARKMLQSEGLAHLSHIICRGRTIDIGGRMYISSKQLHNCILKDKSSHMPAAVGGRQPVMLSQ